RLHPWGAPPPCGRRRPTGGLAAPSSPLYVSTEARPWLPNPAHPRRAAVSAFGFGGSNFHCVLEEAGPEKAEIDWDGDVQILAFAADNPAALDAQLGEWPEGLGWEETRARAFVSRTRFDPSLPCRLLLVARRAPNAPPRLVAAAGNLLPESSEKPFRAPEGVFYGQGPRTGSLAVLFPGQGAQYVGMLRDLVCTFPAAFEVLAEADRLFAA